MYIMQAGAHLPFVHEAGVPFWKKSESDLSVWWLKQAVHRDDLITTEGERLVVLSAGRLNDGPGPDILDAHLIIGETELAGQVEMHQNGLEWHRHGHHTDPAYEDVILHVVVRPSESPDIPTLLVPEGELGGISCIARRAVTTDELLRGARQRFQEKARHMEVLKNVETALLPPLGLGLIEIVCMGPQRNSILQRAAQKVGLPFWPEPRRWQGSRRTFFKSATLDPMIETLLDHRACFDPQVWADFPLTPETGWDSKQNSLAPLGISTMQFREWVVNILAPSRWRSNGFQHWLTLPPFRSYGFEKRIRPKLGLSNTWSIAQQQGLIWWEQRLCHPHCCDKCPLH